MTETQARALTILNVDIHDMMTAGHFAKKMWPDSEGWTRVKNTGNGATSGKGMWLAAGSYLAKLHKKGLVIRSIQGYTVTWRTSYTGKRLLEDYQQNN